MKKIQLKKPILINGEERTVISYNFEELEKDDILGAIANARFNKEFFSALPETDNVLHMWLTYAAIMKVNPDISSMDLERICGKDCVTLVNLGGEFFRSAKAEKESTVQLKGTDYEYSEDNLTAEMYIKADAESRECANKIQKPSVVYATNDLAFHLYIGYHMVNASNPQFTASEFNSLKGKDVIKLINIGRNFILGALVEDYHQESPASSSEEPSEDIHESITAE